jgi:[ribosomal protein S5]-alanine N-acetyltransferase
VVRLRPWQAGDAEALAAAWADPEVQRWTAVPARRSPADAARWIAGEADRRRRGLALDLVIGPADPAEAGAVWGEVGLAPIDWAAKRANLGWWVAPAARGRGAAGRAAVLLATWAADTLGLAVVLDVDPANRASVGVAERVVAAMRGRGTAGRYGVLPTVKRVR